MNSFQKNIAAKLIVSNKDQGVRSYELHDGEKINVGRESSNEIVIKDPRVSRVHACFFNRGTKIFISDLFSRNGTLVNGDMVVGDRELLNQDVVNLGGSVIIVETELAKQTQETDEVTATGGFTNTKIAAAMFRSSLPFEQQAIDRLQKEVLAKGGHNIFTEQNWALAWWHGSSLTKMSLDTVRASNEILQSLKPEIPSLSVFVFALSALLEEEADSAKVNLMGDPLKICVEFNEILMNFPSTVIAEKAIMKRVASEWSFNLLASLRYRDHSTPLELYSLI